MYVTLHYNYHKYFILLTTPYYKLVCYHKYIHHRQLCMYILVLPTREHIAYYKQYACNGTPIRARIALRNFFIYTQLPTNTHDCLSITTLNATDKK